MAESSQPDPFLPEALERRVIEILEGPQAARDRAFENLYREEPLYASRVRERLTRTQNLRQEMDTASGVGERPERIGPYRILEELGEGGMGTVYLAEQRAPIQRRVALKVIKLGMDTRQVLARFEVERQALALMDHPGIARVLDAGRSEEGRSYFAMEYVPGLPITAYCDRNRLGLRERLALFLEICFAVQHAHQKGVIHRDIKPSNILVLDQDGKPQPKIIDFGLARATDRHLAGHTLFTRHGMILGTPEYMSPEQAEMSGLDVDTRTDIYSLGVVLYELLAGALPFDGKKLREAGLAELQRSIREQQPPKPSTRVTTPSPGTSKAEVAERRQADLPALVRELRGDLDWITLKALARDRTQRYQTANELAADIHRHLRHQPVHASPPSLRYRCGKFLRRYRKQVVAGAGVLCLLVAALVVSLTLYIQARSAQREQARARTLAQNKSKEAKAVSDFLVGLFKRASPFSSPGEDLSVRALLDKGAQRIGDDLENDPAVRAQLLCTFSQVYRWLGSYDKAETFMEQGLALKQKLAGPGDPDLLYWRWRLGHVWIAKGKYDRAEREFRQTLEAVRASSEPGTVLEANCMVSLGIARKNLGRHGEAGALFERAVAMLRRHASDDPEDLADALSWWGGYLHDRGEFQRSLPLFEEAAAINDRLPPHTRPQQITILRSLCLSLTALGRLEAAEKAIHHALSVAEKVLGPEHVDLVGVLIDYAHLLQRAGRDREAEAKLRRALGLAQAHLDAGHPQLAWVLNDLGLLLERLGSYPEAASMLRRANGIYAKVYQGDHLFKAISMLNLSEALERVGQLEEAEDLARQSLAMRRRLEPTPGGQVAFGRGRLGEVLAARGKLVEAEELVRQAAAHWQSQERGAVGLARAERLLAWIACLQGKAKEAEQHARRAKQLFSRLPGGRQDLVITIDLLGWSRALQGDAEAAETALRDAIDRCRALFPKGHPYLAMPLTHLASVLGPERGEEGRALLREALELRRRFLPAEDPRVLCSMVRLADACVRLGRFAEAEPLLEAALASWKEGEEAPKGERLDPRQSLIRLYERQGKPEQAKKLREGAGHG